MVRSYITDDAGSTVKLIIPAGEPGAGTYLVTWNGHGDALALWRVADDGTGSLTLANSYTYDSWGRPTTTTHNGIGDLGFRFTYVGEFDVQWDDAFGLGLAYMHARHYSPALGRFLQPDPDGSEANLYAYTANNPVTELDPSGTCFILCVVLVGAILFGSLGAATEVATYAASTPQDQWSAEAAGEAALWGGASGAFLAVPAPGGRIVGSALARALAKVPQAARAAEAAARAAITVRTRVSSVAQHVEQFEWRGGEIRVGPNVRIQPLPRLQGRTWPERLPHYHRRGPINPETGGAIPGQGIGRHRPWQTSPVDRGFWSRF